MSYTPDALARITLANKRRITHGMSDTPIYDVWRMMRSRCDNPTNQNFMLYGGRGIQVCDRWKRFDNFLVDMGQPPFAGATIERQNRDGNYEPENCIWATRQQQGWNTIRSKIWTVDGIECRSLKEASDKFKVSKRTIARWCGGERENCSSRWRYER